MSGIDLPLTVVRKQISSAINLIVQASRLRDGSRKVTQITEVQGLEGDTVVLTDIFRFNDQGDGENGKINGKHEACGMRPNCIKSFKQYGYDLPHNVFMT
jgi:pilus assembly protein CpaF